MAYNDIVTSTKVRITMNVSSLIQYSEIYTHVYRCLEKDEIPHEVTHHAAIAITEALSSYQLTIYKKTGSDISANASVRTLLGFF